MQLHSRARIGVITVAFILTGLFGPGWSSAAAQSATARLSGTVTDQTDSVIPDVEVTAMNLATGLQRKTTTSARGTFTLPLLPPGRYRVVAQREGFAPAEISDLVLSVDDDIAVVLQMKVEELDQTVTVLPDAPRLSTSPAVSMVVDQQFIENLPLNGRNASELVFLAPGAVRDTRTRGTYVYGSTIVPDTQTPAVNGARSNGVAFRLDGANNNDNYTGVANPFPNPDALQEFSIQTNSFSAEFGNAPGGVVNIRTKSGTNTLHGTGFNFFRDGRMNARNFFASEHDDLTRNQFGATAGGPIITNRAFFFGSYQGTRERATEEGLSQFVLTDAMRRGDFSDVSGPLIAPETGAEFPGRQIPRERMDPVALQLLEYMPRSSDRDGRVLYALPDERDFNEFLLKSDQVWGRHQTYQRYYQYNLDQPSVLPDPNVLTQLRNGREIRVHTLAVNDVYSASPKLLNNFTFSYSHNRGRTDPIAPFGVPGLGAELAQPEVPSLETSISGYANFNTSHLAEVTRENFEASNTVSWFPGKHQFLFGVTVLRMRQDIVNDFRKNGTFTFSNDFTGNAAANFMLGLASSFVQGGGEYKALRGWRLNVFVQDDYRPLPSLTMNLGLRFDPWLPYTDELQRVTCYAPGRRSERYPNAPVGLLYAGEAGCPEGGTSTRPWNLAPRLGFAWSPDRENRWSVRGGYGVFFEQPETVLYNRFVNIAPFSPNILLSGVTLSDPYQGRENPFPEKYGPRTPPSDETFDLPVLATSFAPDFRIQYMQNWNLTLERQLGYDIVARAAYVGSKGTHLRTNIEANPAISEPGATVEDTQERRLNTDFSSLIQTTAAGNSSYHSLQLGLEKRFSRRVSFLASYTFGKALDYSSSNTTQGSSNVPNPFDIRSNRGPADYDVPHRLVVSAIYALPALTDSSALIRHTIGGWQLSGIWNWQSGFPFSVMSGSDNSRSGINQDRADLVGSESPALPSDRPKEEWLDRYFDTDAFAPNALGTFGNSGRNILRGPRSFNVDVSVQKRFLMTEDVKLQVHVDFFNVTNTPTFGLPNSTLTSPSFGRILSAGDPRILQLGLKVVF